MVSVGDVGPCGPDASYLICVIRPRLTAIRHLSVAHAGCVLEASGSRLGTRRGKLELHFLGAAAGCPGHISRLRFGDYGASTERA